jgi:hypothetical protein
MRGDGPLDFLPLWGLFVVTLLLVLLAVEAGYRFGRYRWKRATHEKEAPVGEMVGAMLGLLAFLLAFTFGLAATRFESRRAVQLDEANAIGTTYLRSGLLSEPRRAEVRRLLREYVDLRLEFGKSRNVEPAIRLSEELHSQLWSQAVAEGEKNPGSIVVGLFIQSLNETIDLHAKRVSAGLRSRIPGVIWLALYAVTVVSLSAMGFHGGLGGTSRSFVTLAVAFSFTVVLLLIADLDRPMEGWLEVSPQALVDLRRSMTEPQP